MATEEASFDVLVVGGGPAGWAAAITIAEKGLRVALADRARSTQAYGETLAPGGTTLLRGLGAWDGFRAGPHPPCHAYCSVWGSPEVTYYDLLRVPGGPAWMIDRPALVAALRARAVSCGAIWLQFAGSLLCERQAGRWQVKLGSSERMVLARLIVDASGRAGTIARRMGAKYASDGRQVAFIASLATGDTEHHSTSILVEAVADGWWYSAQPRSGQIIIAYFTDSDLVDVRAAREWFGFLDLLERTGATAKRIASVFGALNEGVRVVAAHDSAIDRVWGDGWMAAGDATFAYDPLSGHGITAGLASGRDAGHAIAAALAGHAEALPGYAHRLSRARTLYQKRRLEQYAAEHRWANRPFWARRIIPPRALSTGLRDSRGISLADNHQNSRRS